MNEAEKKAIKYLEFLSNEKCECDACVRAKEEYKTILNLIDKQQKEIEKLKRKKYILNAETNELKEIPIDNNYISKDKIREKIEELEHKDFITMQVVMKHDKEALKIVEVLKELLEEN